LKNLTFGELRFYAQHAAFKIPVNGTKREEERRRSRSRRTAGVLTEDTRVRAKKLHKLPKFPGKERKKLPEGNGSHEDGENKRLSFLPIRFSLYGFSDELQQFRRL
ncbi:hypothetical protein K0M31_016483, partial [Melipona bicolor]